ncbi:MAG: hypothetical protein JST60_09890 [Chloroflexi bacterium SZAS-1]|nr:hypothetical protein [Chloroflexi bacterium SZAS-1]HNP85721.1 hypothetical protein [Kouleothrix sp.]
MYNGNGSSYSGGPYRRRTGVPSLYLYIAIGVLVLFGIWALLSFFRVGIDGYFALVAGILLVLGNLRDLIANPSMQRSNVSLLNTLIGGGLIFFFLGKGGFPPFMAGWYIPAIVLMLIAAPLMLGRAVVYTAYLNTARRAIGTVKGLVGSRIKTY